MPEVSPSTSKQTVSSSLATRVSNRLTQHLQGQSSREDKFNAVCGSDLRGCQDMLNVNGYLTGTLLNLLTALLSKLRSSETTSPLSGPFWYLTDTMIDSTYEPPSCVSTDFPMD